MFLDSLFKNSSNSSNQMNYIKMLDGSIPIFSQFGQNIYASDIVQNCIDIIATEISKLQPRHIYTGTNSIQQIPNSTINALFKFAPNELMTMSEFLERITWLIQMNYNVFIFPVYSTYTASNGNTSRNYSALYPLNPLEADFLQDKTGKLFVKFKFRNGEEFTLAYSDIIHIRKKYSANDIMGGGMNGKPDNQALLKVLQINDTAMEGIAKAVKTSLTIRGILNINTMMETEAQTKERKRLEDAIETSSSGIIAQDLKGDFTPLNPDPKLIDKDTMDFLQNKILNWYGVSIPIFTGNYNDDQYQAFYEKTLEPFLVRLGQAFSNTMFSIREQQVGNQIVFYQKDMQYLSTQSKLNLLNIAGSQGLLTDDQKLAILGYPPLVDGTGNRRTISLNYVDTTIASQYQLKTADKNIQNGGNK